MSVANPCISTPGMSPYVLIIFVIWDANAAGLFANAIKAVMSDIRLAAGNRLVGNGRDDRILFAIVFNCVFVKLFNALILVAKAPAPVLIRPFTCVTSPPVKDFTRFDPKSIPQDIIYSLYRWRFRVWVKINYFTIIS